jgi:hypothetical protein
MGTLRERNLQLINPYLTRVSDFANVSGFSELVLTVKTGFSFQPEALQAVVGSSGSVSLPYGVARQMYTQTGHPFSILLRFCSKI